MAGMTIVGSTMGAGCHVGDWVDHHNSQKKYSSALCKQKVVYLNPYPVDPWWRPVIRNHSLAETTYYINT
jgi:hypothetical protein